MEIKLFEVRDRATFMPVGAIKLSPTGEAERWLLGSAGYSLTFPYILLFRLEGGEITYDAWKWGGGRTLHAAHLYLQGHFDELTSGDVIDVEYILGERPEPKRSERSTL